MFPIGEYAPDFNEKIQSPGDLPAPEIIRKSRSFKTRSCPKCKTKAPRVREYQRIFHELGDPVRQKPRDVHFIYSQHCCKNCHYYFHDDFDDLVLPYSQYSTKIVHMAIRLVVEDGLPYGETSWHLWRDHFVWVPRGTVQNWVEGAGKKKLSGR